MKFIIAYRLKRKNARRKILLKYTGDTEEDAKHAFSRIIKSYGDADKKHYELLTGDWKHIQYYERDS